MESLRSAKRVTQCVARFFYVTNEQTYGHIVDRSETQPIVTHFLILITMYTHSNNEQHSLRAIHHIARIYRTTSPRSRQIVRDIDHVIATYELHDKEAALACNRYITTKYPILYKFAYSYGLRPMSESEINKRTEPELQHMLYSLCLFLYDGLQSQYPKAMRARPKITLAAI